MMKRAIRILTILFLFSGIIGVFATQTSHAAPNLVNYQGSLTDSGGTPVTDSSVSMTFRVYDDPTSTAPVNKLWEETQTVSVVNGIYNVLLGSGTTITGSFDPALFASDTRWLEVEVNAEVLTPRQQLTSVVFALRAEEADNAATAGDANTVDGYEGVDLEESAEIDTDILTHAGNASAHHTKTSTFPELAGQASDAQIPPAIARDSEIMPTVLAGDGVGSTMDADLLDGLDSSAFLNTINDYGRSGVAINLYEGIQPIVKKYVNTTGDTMTGGLNVLGNVGIGTTTPSETLTVAGTIESTSGGVKYPDGSMQTTAAYQLPNRILVAPSGGDYTSIQAAIDGIMPGASNPYIIEVVPGTYTENIIMKSYIHLKGSGKHSTVLIPGSGSGTAIMLQNLTGVTISGLHITGFNGSTMVGDYGIVDIASSPTIMDCQITAFDGATAGYPAGVYSENSSPRIIRNHISNNERKGIYLKEANALITGNDFSYQTGFLSSQDYGVESDSSTAIISDNYFSGGDYGILAYESNSPSSLIISNNNFFEVSGADIIHGFANIMGNMITGYDSYSGVGIAIRQSAGMVRIIGNRFLDIGTGVADSGTAQVIGNSFSNTNNNSVFSVNGSTLLWGNTVSGTTPAPGIGGQIITPGDIKLTSTDKDVAISANGKLSQTGTTYELVTPNGTLTMDASGVAIDNNQGSYISVAPTGVIQILSNNGTRIDIDATGNMSIQSVQDIDINATGDLNLTGANVNITSTLNTNIKANGALDLTSAANTDMTAGGSTTMTAGSILDLNGAMINLN